MVFDRWISSCSAFDYQSVSPGRLRSDINDPEVDGPQHAAELADRFAVTHGGRPGGLIGKRKLLRSLEENTNRKSLLRVGQGDLGS